MTHSLAGLCVLGWYYYIVPRWKHELESIGYEISRLAVALFRQSDLVVNYWYLLVIIGPPTLMMDFLLTRWMAKQIGLRWAIVYAACVTLTLLCHIAYGQFLLHQAAVVLNEYVSIYGPAPTTY